MKKGRATFLGCSLLLIAAATIAPSAHAVANDSSPAFLCLACEPLAGADALLNILLFTPLGLALAMNGARMSRALLVGTVVSVTVETLQHFGIPAGRVANITDVITNALGTILGAAIGWRYRRLLLPNVQQARAWLSVAMCCVVGMLAFTSWGLSRDVAQPNQSARNEGVRNASAGSADRMARSAMPFTPGFGWYHGYILDASVHGEHFDHPGDGPLILQGELASFDSMSMRVAKRDERQELVPFLYLHRPHETAPQLIVGQVGPNLQMRATLRASKWHLALPRLVLPAAFATESHDIRTIHVVVARDHWGAASDQGGAKVHALLPLSVGLGWTLFQNVLSNDGMTGTLLSFAWLASLALPVGYWCVLARIRVAASLVLATIATALLVIPWAAGIASASLTEWSGMLFGFVSGFTCGLVALRHVQGMPSARTPESA